MRKYETRPLSTRVCRKLPKLRRRNTVNPSSSKPKKIPNERLQRHVGELKHELSQQQEESARNFSGRAALSRSTRRKKNQIGQKAISHVSIFHAEFRVSVRLTETRCSHAHTREEMSQ